MRSIKVDKNIGKAKCRFCGTPLRYSFIDLGMQPLCESYLSINQLNQMEPFYPLHAYVCEKCLLVQVEEYVSPKEIFSEYAYFSSYSDSWLEHSKKYVDMIIKKLNLSSESKAIEIGSNDGYLLQYFVEKGVPVLGVEPAGNVAEVAKKRGIPTLIEFFGVETANKMKSDGTLADLIIGNNVLAQVPELNDFIEGMKLILKPEGIITLEFPYLMKLMEGNQFDTIYHEHFSYFSIITTKKIFSKHGLTIFDVEEISTHGGSLRIYVRHDNDTSKSISQNVKILTKKEKMAGFDKIDAYLSFKNKVFNTKNKLLSFLIKAKEADKKIVGYGAPGKGNTLLNFCGIRVDFLEYTVDRNPYKQNKFLPGTHIPIFHPEKIFHTKPDYVLILPWNLKDEIIKQMSKIFEWGGKFVVPIPDVQIINLESAGGGDI